MLDEKYELALPYLYKSIALNPHRREAFRHHSYVSHRADAVMVGFGTQGYQLALRRLAHLIDKKMA